MGYAAAMTSAASDLDHILNHRSLKKSRRRWRLFGLVIIALVALACLAALFDGPLRGPHIARIYVTGLITGDDAQLKLIEDLRNNDNVKGLIVRIDSPGGTTAGSEALYDEIHAFSARKPVVAVMDTVAASGGYITALAADHIVARRNTITGSIGVIFTYPEVSALLNTLGVKMEEVKSGELKAEPSPYKPTSDKARAATMSLVQDGFDWFKGLVAERRKLTPERTAVLADGRVYSGGQAVKEGLVDEIGSELEGRGWLTRKLAEDGEPNTDSLPVQTYTPVKDQSLKVSFSQAAMEAFGFGRLADAASRAKLDGLLVLWHPQL